MDRPEQEGVRYIPIDGTPRPVYYPDAGNMAAHIANILAGVDYPLVPIPDFRPRAVIDVGANVGAAALYFLSRYPSSRVWCFEPAPANVAYLRRNTGFTDRIEVCPYGLYSRTVRAPLYQGKSQCMQHSVYPGPEVTDRATPVELRCAAEELAGVTEEPWLLKIDVEGAELAVLQSLGPLLVRAGVIYLEYHSERERLAFDELLARDFLLWRSSAQFPHRGNVAYVAKAVVAASGFAAWPIEPRELEGTDA